MAPNIVAPIQRVRLTDSKDVLEAKRKEVSESVKSDEALVAWLHKIGFVNSAMEDQLKDDLYGYVDKPLLDKWKQYNQKLTQLGHTHPRMTQEDREATALKIAFSSVSK